MYSEIDLLKLIDQISIQKDHEYVQLNEIYSRITSDYRSEIVQHLDTLINLGVIKTSHNDANKFQIAGVTSKFKYEHVNNDVAKYEDIKEWLDSEWSRFPKNQT